MLRLLKIFSFPLAIVLAIFLFSVFLPRQVIFNSGNVKVQVERADSVIEKQEGLMFRDKLADGHGMLFVNVETPSFWMKNVKFPLDLIFISKDKKIVDIKQNFQPCPVENCPTYTATVAAKYVLEVNAGFVEKNQISIGDAISFSCSWF